MNEEVEDRLPFSFCLLTSALASFLDYRDEDGGEFVALGTKRLQLGRWHYFLIDEQLQPIRGLIRAPARPLRAGCSASLSHSVRLLQFPQRVAAFGDELGFAPSAMRFPVVRPAGCSRAEQLFAQNLGLRRFWQASEQSDDSQRKLFGSVLEVVFFLHHSDFPLHPCRRSKARFEVRVKKDESEAWPSSLFLLLSSFHRWRR